MCLVLASGSALGQDFDGVPPALPASQSEYTVKSCTWRERACAYPHLVVSADAGFSHFAEGSPFGFQTGTGSATQYGPAWGARIGAEITPWFAIEAHYIGSYNHGKAFVSKGGGSSLITNAAAAELRFTAPTAYVQPYLFFGGGLYSTSVGGSATSTQFIGSTEFGIPIGVGFQFLLPRGVSLGAEMTYHRFFGESFSENEEIGGGEPLSLNAVMRMRF